MHDVNHAMAFLREKTGLSKLELDQNGHVDLVFDGKLPVDIYRLDDRHLELSAVLDEPDPGLARETLVALLTANYLGDATGFGRVALDPRDQSILLCERIDVTVLDGPALERRILDFVAHVALWNSGKLDELLEAGPAEEAEPEFGGDSMVFRG